MSSRLSIDELFIDLFTNCLSIVVTPWKFRAYYEEKDARTRKFIERIVAEFKENGSVSDQQLGASGRPRSVCNPSIITTTKLNVKPFKD